MRKVSYVMGLAVLVAALAFLPGVSHSAMWVGGELGGNFFAGTDVNVNLANAPTITNKDVNINPSVIAGITVGYDFINTGFGGYNYPDWMKYFMFAMDFTYNRIDRPQQGVTITIGGVSGNGTISKIEGTMAVLSFLFMGHYGFLPDSDVPQGRLHPYVGVGPGIVFSTVDTGNFGGGSHGSTNVALVVESGLRFFALKNVSLDAAFRYRMFNPSYNVDGRGDNGTVDFEMNSFSFLARANYHF